MEMVSSCSDLCGRCLPSSTPVPQGMAPPLSSPFPSQVILSIDDHGEVMFNTAVCSLRVMQAFQVCVRGGGSPDRHFTAASVAQFSAQPPLQLPVSPLLGPVPTHPSSARALPPLTPSLLGLSQEAQCALITTKHFSFEMNCAQLNNNLMCYEQALEFSNDVQVCEG